jgi:catechol 2,3-dioxygenase-like lactoylglutathione lyase family enzyme
MKTSIDQYCINVTDLDKSLQFWEEALGLEITHRIETAAGPVGV